MHDNPYESPAGDAIPECTERPQLSPEQLNRLEWEIKKQATNSVVAGVVGIVFWIVSPMAFICGRKAISLIEEHGVGRQYLRTANRGISLGYVGLVMFAAVVLGSLG
jgi:hypothetical protein